MEFTYLAVANYTILVGVILFPVLSDAHHLDKLGIHSDELVNFLAAAVVVMDIQQVKIIAHKLLDVTKVFYNDILNSGYS